MSQHLFENSYSKPKTQIVIPDRVALRAATRYNVNGDCWESAYSVASHGYSQIGWQEKAKTRTTTAHRAAWVHYHGKQIDEGYTIDHLCKNRRCVNPAHLRALPNFENARRTYGDDWVLGQCKHGHSNEHLHKEPNGRMRCLRCAREHKRQWVKQNPDKVRAYNKKYRDKKRSAKHRSAKH